MVQKQLQIDFGLDWDKCLGYFYVNFQEWHKDITQEMLKRWPACSTVGRDATTWNCFQSLKCEKTPV